MFHIRRIHSCLTAGYFLLLLRTGDVFERLVGLLLGLLLGDLEDRERFGFSVSLLFDAGVFLRLRIFSLRSSSATDIF